MRKYFDQTFKTKFSEQTMNKMQEYQWVVEEMEQEFEYPEKDVQTFDEFMSCFHKYESHFFYFIRIYEIDKSELTINNEFLKIISNIAKYSLKEITIKRVIDNEKYKNFTILLLLGILGSIVQKNKNHGSYDFGMFVYYNWFELHDLDSISKDNLIKIDKLLKKMDIKETKKIIEIYNDNINKIEKKYNNNNLNSLKQYHKLFNNSGYKNMRFCTWQENFLLTMSRIRLTISEIVPLFSNNHEKIPNYDAWNKEIIKKLKLFFYDNDDATTIINIIDYKLNNEKIIEKTQKIAFNEALKIIKSKNKPYEYDNIWFNIIIEYMRIDKSYINKNIGTIFIELKKKRNIEIILFLKENGFKIDSEMRKKINDYYMKRIKSIEKIQLLYEFNEFIKDQYIKTNINIEIVNKIRKIFLDLIKKQNTDIEVSLSFYNIINFYIEIKGRLNDELINKYVFELLDLWQNDYYQQSLNSLSMRSYKQTIENKEIKKFNRAFIENPIISLRSSFSWNEKKILNKMKKTSEHALSAMIKENTIYIDKFFPYMKKIDITTHDSLEKILSQYLERIQIKYEEQLLNSNMKSVEYIYSIFEENNYYINLFVNLLDKETYEKMYADIKQSFLKYDLLEYPQRVTVAHITQLIPLLELLIRELGIKNNVLPFKEKKNQIHVMKDSSTILQSIIKNSYKMSNNFENIEVYLFLYNNLYNVNFLNLRNELIHARQYLDDQQEMDFAFKVFVLSIFWANIELYI